MLITIFKKFSLSSKYVFKRHLISGITLQFSPKHYSKSILHVNTKVVKDVLLYRYENSKRFIFINLFSLTQLGIWSYLSYFTYNFLRDAPVPKDKSNLRFWQKVNLGENLFRNTISITCLSIGYLFCIAAFSYTVRSVRYVVLRKGGDHLTLVTYGPFGKNLFLDVPLTKVSATQSRDRAGVSLPIKIQGKWLHYVLDMKGEFLHQQLFDATAGLKRNI